MAGNLRMRIAVPVAALLVVTLGVFGWTTWRQLEEDVASTQRA